MERQTPERATTVFATPPRARPRSSLLLQPWALPLLLVLALSVVGAVLAYQAPPAGVVQVGWLGDRLFLDASSTLRAEAAQQGQFYPDDLTPDSPTGRSRWTRERAVVTLPNLGAGTDVELTLLVQGWPTDILDAPSTGVETNADSVQPIVTLRVDGTELDQFVPAPEWTTYEFVVPARLHNGSDLELEITTAATFTDTARGSDPRPKGIRLAQVQVNPVTDTVNAWLPPAWGAVLLLTVAGVLLYLLMIRLFNSVALGFFSTMLLVGGAGAGLALMRLWMGAALTLLLCVLGIGLILAWQRPLLQGLRNLLQHYAQGRALNYGLVAAALAWLGLVIARSVAYLRENSLDLGLLQSTFPDSLLIGMLGVGLLALILVLGREGLPQLADQIVAMVGSRRGALALLFIVGAIWLSYEAWVAFTLPYVGHADYADNAVVARNIVTGRGWVVDYVTQFYHLNPPDQGVTRPQETWPLLQPLWIAPFVSSLGTEEWVAKLPNLFFSAVLLLLTYHIGAYIWDRRVGLVAALLVITNHLFFYLMIYTTSDLAFVVFTFGAVYLIYRAATATQHRHGFLIGSAILTGLMMLQKPSGALIAVGIGLWYLGYRLPQDWPRPQRTALRFGLWAGLALLVLSPYLVRNMVEFGRPVYSTESYDAWVLGYRGNDGDSWNDIYRVFDPELGGPGLPDRSWILRWGFDQTYAKFLVQLNALRDYLMPVWSDPPALLLTAEGRPYLFSSSETKNLLTPLGAWLALIGFVGALWARRRLASLLLFAFGPYTLFLLTYWRTNEERYFLMVMPWLFLLAAWVIWAGYDRLAAIADRRWSPLALILVGLTLVLIVQPSWERIAYKIEHEPAKWAPDITAYAWLQANTPPDAVMMTRNPWQLNWHAERPAVMIPNTSDQELFCYLADYYAAEYLVFENLQRIKGDIVTLLAPLANARTAQAGTTIDGFELVYASPTEFDRVLIYRFPEERTSQCIDGE